MQELVEVLKTAHMAASGHFPQRRKEASQEPYINHLLEVAMLVAEATRGEDPALIKAALLHDAFDTALLRMRKAICQHEISIKAER